MPVLRVSRRIIPAWLCWCLIIEDVIDLWHCMSICLVLCWLLQLCRCSCSWQGMLIIGHQQICV